MMSCTSLWAGELLPCAGSLASTETFTNTLEDVHDELWKVVRVGELVSPMEVSPTAL